MRQCGTFPSRGSRGQPNGGVAITVWLVEIFSVLKEKGISKTNIMSLGRHLDQRTKHWLSESIEENWEKFESGAMTIPEMQALLKDFVYFPDIDWSEMVTMVQKEIADVKSDPAMAEEREQLSLAFDLKKLDDDYEGDEGEDNEGDYSEAEEVAEGEEN
jgi:hypothetical protein